MTSLTTIINILGGVQGLFLCFLLFALKKDQLRANKYLAMVVLILSVTLIISFLHFTKLILHVPHLFAITPTFTLLYGPLLLFYVASLLIPDYKVSFKQMLHFVPFLIQVKLLMPYLTMPGDRKASYLMNIFEDRYLPPLNAEAMFRILHLVIYLSICFAIYFKAVQGNNHENKPHKIRLKWVRNLVIVSGMIWGVYTSLYFYDQNLLNSVLPTVITVAIYAMAYMGFKYPEIVQDVQIRKASEKYEFSKLTAEEKVKHCEHLLTLMQDQKLFTEPELKLNQVAKILNISAQNLSQIINEKFRQSFPDFINSFRVEEAKKRLLDSNNKHLTILAIANEVGFNSKSAFNSTFKKFTDQTPSEFVRKQNHSYMPT
ncbi:helix-turn-helix domain-containing protein [candidate division KSB1 bacterium]|nr:helix-turn-helix domain-containing protein [candidate division KSB1 bacterium]